MLQSHYGSKEIMLETNPRWEETLEEGKDVIRSKIRVD